MALVPLVTFRFGMPQTRTKGVVSCILGLVCTVGTRFRHPGLYETDRVDTVTDILVDNAQEQVRTVLAPKIAQLSRNALNVMPMPFLYFQKLNSGRRCSCFGVNDDPNARCALCYGVGLVGGFIKRGTRTVVVDVTAANVRCVNVAPNYQRPTRPIGFTLLDSAVYGYLDVDLDIQRSVGLDDLTILKHAELNCYCEPYLRVPTDTDWVPLTESNLKVRLGHTKIQVRVVFRRMGPKDPLPTLAGIRVTTKLIPDGTVKVDVPRVNESKTLQDFGLQDTWSTQNFFIDAQLKNIATQDFFYNVLDGSRWKVVEVKSNVIAGINTSWDVVCRLVQTYEPAILVPVGAVTAPDARPPAANIAALDGPESTASKRPETFPVQTSATTASPGQAVPAPFVHVQQGLIGTERAQIEHDLKKR